MIPARPADPRRVYPVSEITRLIKTALENDFADIWIEGEISNFRRPSSGHLYFTLKDESAQIRAVFFRGSQTALRFELKDGLKVRVFGSVSVYERSGDYQIIVRRAEEAGKGDLQRAFEDLKNKLAAEGLFDADRKKILPLLPQHVAVVTSSTGAALRDILNVVSRRFPNLHILIAPVKVQGEGAAAQIAHAIDFLNERGGLDAMIVGRGGGSLEDLWCFNEEIVARAIARSRIPVISAVGHETDFTISDFVADLRAPTPSAAAELVVGRKDDFSERVDRLAQRLSRALRIRGLELRNRLTAAARSHVLRDPLSRLRQLAQRLDGIEVRIAHAMRDAPRACRARTDALSLRLDAAMRLRAQASRQTLRRLGGQLDALNPRGVLQRGYTITRAADGRVLRALRDAHPGDALRTELSDGIVESIVSSTKESNHGR